MWRAQTSPNSLARTCCSKARTLMAAPLWKAQVRHAPFCFALRPLIAHFAAREAQTAQPTGTTLATSNVRTPLPKLLRGPPLREYQHIGLDWLVAMYEKGLNGILVRSRCILVCKRYLVLTFDQG